MDEYFDALQIEQDLRVPVTDAGYRTLEDLYDATVDELVKGGVKLPVAKKLKKYLPERENGAANLHLVLRDIGEQEGEEQQPEQQHPTPTTTTSADAGSTNVGSDTPNNINTSSEDGEERAATKAKRRLEEGGAQPVPATPAHGDDADGNTTDELDAADDIERGVGVAHTLPPPATQPATKPTAAIPAAAEAELAAERDRKRKCAGHHSKNAVEKEATERAEIERKKAKKKEQKRQEKRQEKRAQKEKDRAAMEAKEAALAQLASEQPADKALTQLKQHLLEYLGEERERSLELALATLNVMGSVQVTKADLETNVDAVKTLKKIAKTFAAGSEDEGTSKSLELATAIKTAAGTVYAAWAEVFEGSKEQKLQDSDDDDSGDSDDAAVTSTAEDAEEDVDAASLLAGGGAPVVVAQLNTLDKDAKPYVILFCIRCICVLARLVLFLC
jgi:hypothetical protein